MGCCRYTQVAITANDPWLLDRVRALEWCCTKLWHAVTEEELLSRASRLHPLEQTPLQLELDLLLLGKAKGRFLSEARRMVACAFT